MALGPVFQKFSRRMLPAFLNASILKSCRMCQKRVLDKAMVRDVRGSFCSQSCADKYWWSLQQRPDSRSSQGI